MTNPPTPFEDATPRSDRNRPDAEATILYPRGADSTTVAAPGVRRVGVGGDETVVLTGRQGPSDGRDPAAEALPAIVADSSSFAPAWLLGVAAVAVIGAAAVGFYALRPAPAPTKARPPSVSTNELHPPGARGGVSDFPPSLRPSAAPSDTVSPAADSARTSRSEVSRASGK